MFCSVLQERDFTYPNHWSSFPKVLGSWALSQIRPLVGICVMASLSLPLVLLSIWRSPPCLLEAFSAKRKPSQAPVLTAPLPVLCFPVTLWCLAGVRTTLCFSAECGGWWPTGTSERPGLWHIATSPSQQETYKESRTSAACVPEFQNVLTTWDQALSTSAPLSLWTRCCFVVWGTAGTLSRHTAAPLLPAVTTKNISSCCQMPPHSVVQICRPVS